MSTSFAVVEFIGEKSVDIVLESWIETREGISVLLHACYAVSMFRINCIKIRQSQSSDGYRYYKTLQVVFNISIVIVLLLSPN